MVMGIINYCLPGGGRKADSVTRAVYKCVMLIGMCNIWYCLFVCFVVCLFVCL